ncbi:hypothetical protein COO20_00035 [Thalassospira marina]|uniref:Uncharacterized protein n=1 Tax=Thalassospira marina TaxID=2048283 RepID=A0A2N3KYV9_9PROT|nr:hypothetical protein COO20_00035 [Thalassospira marina]
MYFWQADYGENDIVLPKFRDFDRLIPGDIGVVISFTVAWLCTKFGVCEGFTIAPTPGLSFRLIHHFGASVGQKGSPYIRQSLAVSRDRSARSSWPFPRCFPRIFGKPGNKKAPDMGAF